MEVDIILATDWQINLTGSSDQVKLVYIILYYNRPVPQFISNCQRVHIEHEGYLQKGILTDTRGYLKIHLRIYLQIHCRM